MPCEEGGFMTSVGERHTPTIGSTARGGGNGGSLIGKWGWSASGSGKLCKRIEERHRAKKKWDSMIAWVPKAANVKIEDALRPRAN